MRVIQDLFGKILDEWLRSIDKNIPRNYTIFRLQVLDFGALFRVVEARCLCRMGEPGPQHGALELVWTTSSIKGVNPLRIQADLCQPLAGLMTYPMPLPIDTGEPAYRTFACSLGDLNRIASFSNRNYGKSMELSGAGGDVDPDVGRFKALAETLERYCSCVYDESQFIWTTGKDLGDEALDLDCVPVCSDEELSHPDCPLVRPSKHKEIRWVRGVELTSGKLLWTPAVMSYLYIPYKVEAERFWAPISTGCAIHQCYEQALINAINEVIERDSVALTWLQRLDLPRLTVDRSRLPDTARAFYDQTHHYPYYETHYFDATTDIGVPTIYCVQSAPHNEKVRTVVMCTTDLDPLQAFSKIHREAASVRIALQNKEYHDKPVDQFLDVTDGALYMGHPSRVEHFEFLLRSKTEKPLHELRNLSVGNPALDLRLLLSLLCERGHQVVAVDLTTDEARRCGLYAVRVIIPSLQPLSFIHRARFLGHPRLYQAPEAMGYGVKQEVEINPMPQPFA